MSPRRTWSQELDHIRVDPKYVTPGIVRRYDIVAGPDASSLEFPVQYGVPSKVHNYVLRPTPGEPRLPFLAGIRAQVRSDRRPRPPYHRPPAVAEVARRTHLPLVHLNADPRASGVLNGDLGRRYWETNPAAPTRTRLDLNGYVGIGNGVLSTHPVTGIPHRFEFGGRYLPQRYDDLQRSTVSSWPTGVGRVAMFWRSIESETDRPPEEVHDFLDQRLLTDGT
jgi:hypothetical protein